MGPVQEYEAIPAGPPIRSSGDPTHTGLLLDAVGVGKGFTTAVVLAEFEHPFPSTTVRVYTPDIAGVADSDTTGDC